ncbi:hypothetical protein FB567DRAFT_595909 [Paraphoma chrysanthemicola]|uniref:Uncharacterized protein n=1 Tax=Paraphoma chrysanthemicola TaxID=798071 RepID=A0A8K0R0L8_9PLEO|nr:hypothetical protein FB567DRAFT_595909 [Paraphoma chrysanthemicola]
MTMHFILLLIKPQPQDAGKYTHTISYCYAIEDAKLKLSLWITSAIQLWVVKIGEPSKANGHGLTFKNHEQRGQPQWCRKSDGPWNNIHPCGSVVIDTMQGQGEGNYAMSYASYGYRTESSDPDPGRHSMRINYEALKKHTAPATQIAHEWDPWIRHIFGMQHEHQRYDAETYIHFQCHNLADYDAIEAKVAKKGEVTMDQVCSDGRLAVLYGFMANDWSNTLHLFGENLNARLGPFDIKSIMLYEAKAGMKPGNDATNIHHVPILRWRTADPHPKGVTSDNCEVYGPNRTPSDGDYRFV